MKGTNGKRIMEPHTWAIGRMSWDGQIRAYLALDRTGLTPPVWTPQPSKATRLTRRDATQSAEDWDNFAATKGLTYRHLAIEMERDDD